MADAFAKVGAGIGYPATFALRADLGFKQATNRYAEPWALSGVAYCEDVSAETPNVKSERRPASDGK